MVLFADHQEPLHSIGTSLHWLRRCRNQHVGPNREIKRILRYCTFDKRTIQLVVSDSIPISRNMGAMMLGISKAAAAPSSVEPVALSMQLPLRLVSLIRSGIMPYPAPPNHRLRDPKYHLIETIRPLIEVHWGV